MGITAQRRRITKFKTAAVNKIGWTIFFFSLVGGASILAASWMGDAARWPLSRITLSGELRHTSDQQVLESLQPILPLSSFFSQSVELIQRQLEGLPWVSRAAVRKQWPDQIKIHLEEHRVCASWNGDRLIDKEGQVFSAPLELDSARDLPQFYGPEGSEVVLLKAWMEFNSLLVGSPLKVTQLEVDARQAWHLILGRRFHLLLGRKEHEERLRRFMALYPILGEGAGSRVDLRYTAGAAVSEAVIPTMLHLSEQIK